MDAKFTGNQISQKRKALCLTQKELAEKLHVTDKAVSKWERGINFPDLGLMENLAKTLKTTPACLLGLEEASQTETVSALTEISQEQLEEARKDLRIFSWGSIVTAVLLALTYHLTQKRAVEVYYLLTTMITIIVVVGLGYVYKYGEMKKWEPVDLGTFFGALLPVLIWNSYYFLTGYSLSQVLTWVLVAVASFFIQIHFLQVMRPRFMQLLPFTLSALYTAWQFFLEGPNMSKLIPVVCCLAVVCIDLYRHPEKRAINWKALMIGISLVLILVVLICLLCYPDLVRTYVVVNQDRLEAYAENLLESGQNGTFGPWDVTAYPELGIVEFQATAHGLVPESTYEGFYYSASGEHVSFPGFANQDHNLGIDALFLDLAENSDNFQTSTQFAPNWFWFALHY